jgi:hypothetical protein
MNNTKVLLPAEPAYALSSSNPSYPLAIGSLANFSGSNGWRGDIACVLIYSGSLTATERKYVEEGLMARYGISSERTRPGSRSYPIDRDANDYDAFGIVQNFGDVLNIVARNGTTHDADDGEVHQGRTAGGKQTWTQSLVAGTSPDIDLRNVGGGVVPATNTGIIIYARHERTPDDWLTMVIRRTTNKASSWVYVDAIEHSVFNNGNGYVTSPYGGIVELPSGNLLLPIYSFDGTNYTVWFLESSDDGQNWSEGDTMINTTSFQITEASVIYLDGAADGSSRLLAVARVDDGVMRQLKSIDGGVNWTDQGVLPFSQGVGKDVSPWLILYDGVVHLIYADRTDDQLKVTTTMPDAAIAGTSGWLTPIAKYDSQANNPDAQFGMPSACAFKDSVAVAFFDAFGAEDPGMRFEL